MGRFSKLTEQDLDRLVAGKAPSDDVDHAALAGFFRDVKREYLQPPDADTAANHLAAIAQAAAESRRPSTTRPRGRFAVRNPLAQTRIKLLVLTGATALLLAAFGGIAHAGALPSPLQHTVSNVAGTFGVSVPDGDEHPGDQGVQDPANTEQVTDDQGDQNDQGDTPSSTDTSDQGDQNDQGGSSSNSGSRSGGKATAGATDPGTSSDQGDQNDQGNQNDQGGSADDGQSSQDDQGSSSDQGDQGGSGSGSGEGDQGSSGTGHHSGGDSSSHQSSGSGDQGGSGQGDQGGNDQGGGGGQDG